WQERVRRVMEAAEVLDAVLYFDNLGDLLAERPGAHIDLAGAIKPYLEDGKVRLVGEVLSESLDLFEGRHIGFFTCLTPPPAPPPACTAGRGGPPPSPAAPGRSTPGAPSRSARSSAPPPSGRS